MVRPLLGSSLHMGKLPKPGDLEKLRSHVATTADLATALLVGLKELDEEFVALLPSLVELTNGDREAYVARLCGFDTALGQHLRDLVEALADVLAGLTSADAGQRWLRHRVGGLEAGEDTAA